MLKKSMYLAFFVMVLSLIITIKAQAERVGWWRLDDGSGTVIVDSSGNENQGEFVGDPVWVGGILGGALLMDGGDYVEVPGAAAINPKSVTLMSWINFTTVASSAMTRQDFLSRADDYAISLHEQFADEKLHGIITNEGEWAVVHGNTQVVPDTWYHVAVTYSEDTKILSIFLNGKVDGELEVPTGIENRLGGPLTIGTYAGRDLLGMIDDVQIWDNALSAEEIQAAMEGDEVVCAFGPYPPKGAVEVSRDVVLRWKRGDYAVTHDVYFGTDANDVNDAGRDNPLDVLVSRGQDEIYDPPGLLEYGQTYYWRVDEVNDAEADSPWKGNLWSFTTANYIVLEDFEDYNDSSPNEIWNTWIDGFGDSTNGSIAGYPDPDFIAGEHYVETDIAHGGDQSMPVFYNNSGGIYSEVSKTLTEMRDWTIDDIITLTLFYYGDFGNGLDTMYIALNGNAVIVNEDPKAVFASEWTQWDIPLQDFADLGVDLSSVNSISIGFGDRNNPAPGGSGCVFFDDIRLSRSEPIETEPDEESVDPGTANLRAYYAFENNTQDTSGRGQNGSVSGNPAYVTGPTGYGTAIELDGNGDFITLPIGSLISSLTDSSFTTWINWAGTGGSWQRVFDFGSGEDINMFLTLNAVGSSTRFAITTGGSTNEEQTTSPGVLAVGWHHLAVTIDPTNTTHTLYIDGKVAAQNTEAINTPSSLGQTTQNWLGLSQYSADPFLVGSLDEFRIYNRVLTKSEVLFLAGR